jgi:hypothetical protein
MVLLHEEHLRHFVHTWRLALATSVSLPPSDDPAYASLGALGQHVLGAAGGYMDAERIAVHDYDDHIKKHGCSL